MKVLNYYECYITSKFGVQSKVFSYDLNALKTVLNYYKKAGFSISNNIYSNPTAEIEISLDDYKKVYTETFA